MAAAGSAAPRIFVGYIPVLHRGYLELFDRIQPDQIWVLDEDVLAQVDQLRKDVRRVAPSQIVQMVQPLVPAEIRLVSEAALAADLTTFSAASFHLPDDDVSEYLLKKFYSKKHKVTLESVFLRWDKKKSLDEQSVEDVPVIAADDHIRAALKEAAQQQQQSGDWWRQVGAALVQDGRVLAQAHNHHLPSEQTPYIDGDPRGNFHKGEHRDKTTAIHAEASVIGQAARAGIPLEGASLVVTTFPCPTCAKLIATAGISEVYFSEGYAMVDGRRVLESAGVSLYRLS